MQRELAILIPHSFRTGACIFLHIQNVDTEYIKLQLKWRINPFRIYLRNIIQLADRNIYIYTISNAQLSVNQRGGYFFLLMLLFVGCFSVIDDISSYHMFLIVYLHSIIRECHILSLTWLVEWGEKPSFWGKTLFYLV